MENIPLLQHHKFALTRTVNTHAHTKRREDYATLRPDVVELTLINRAGVKLLFQVNKRAIFQPRPEVHN